VSGSSPVSGLVVVDKPGGITSHGVVARVRRLAGTRKVGHAGTLDPMATGVLVLGVNRATRLLGHLMLTRKAYDATICLGVATTTDDAEGEVLATVPAGHLTDADVAAVAGRYVGEIQQVPTAVSAIKVDGRRAYQRVRAGEDIELAARTVTIDEISWGPVRHEGELAFLDVSVRCSSGTYIRAIARDLGVALGVGGHLAMLRRTAVGPFDVASARTLEQLEEDFEIVPIADAARAAFATYQLDEAQAADVRFGRPLDITVADNTAVFAPDGEFLALYAMKDALARPVAVFTG
jgi:tRNA pseudouridine55 synthase